jgi:hypothetical protein
MAVSPGVGLSFSQPVIFSSRDRGRKATTFWSAAIHRRFFSLNKKRYSPRLFFIKKKAAMNRRTPKAPGRSRE